MPQDRPAEQAVASQARAQGMCTQLLRDRAASRCVLLSSARTYLKNV